MAVLNPKLAILVAILLYATTCVDGMVKERADFQARSPAESKAMKPKEAADMPLEDSVSRQSSLEDLIYNQCMPAKHVKDVTRMGVSCKCKNCDYHGYRNKWCYTSDDKKHHQYCCHGECTPEPTGGLTWIDGLHGMKLDIKWYCKASSKIFPVYTECNPKKNTLNPTSGVIPSKWDSLLQFSG